MRACVISGLMLVGFLRAQEAKLATSSRATLFEVSKMGSVAAAACEDGKLYIWKLPEKQVLREIYLAGQSLDALAISPDGRLIAAGDHAGGYSVWETSTGERKMHLNTPFYPFRLAFSPDSNQVAIAAVGQPVQIYSAATGKRIFELQSPTGGTAAVAFSADGNHIATGDVDTGVRIYGARNRELLARNTDSLLMPLSVVFTSDGKTLLVGGIDRTIRWLEAASGAMTRKSAELVDPTISLDLSPDGMFVSSLLMHADDLLLAAPVLIWETSSGRKVQEWLPETRALGGAWTQNGLLFATATDKSVDIWRVR